MLFISLCSKGSSERRSAPRLRPYIWLRSLEPAECTKGSERGPFQAAQQEKSRSNSSKWGPQTPPELPSLFEMCVLPTGLWEH